MTRSRTRALLLLALLGVTLAAGGAALWKRLQEDPAPLSIPTIQIREPDGLSFDVYVPPDLDASRKHPAVLGSSPGGDARWLLPSWQRACDRFGWIFIASHNFKNGPWSEAAEALQLRALTVAKERFPIDMSRLYAAGLSGGGMHSHDLIACHPDLFRGIVVNTGMMPHRYPGNDPLDREHHPRGKLAVLVASPTDHRYREMKDDRAILESLGWIVRWIEFEGGHRMAPSSVYVDAVAWLDSDRPIK